MPSLAPPSLLAEFQAMSEDTMPDVVTIEDTYGEPMPDDIGGAEYDLSMVQLTFGRISPLQNSALESEGGTQLAKDRLEVLVLPLDARVTDTSVITVDSVRFGTIVRYTVEEVVPCGTHAVHRKVIVKPIQEDV